MYGSGKMEVEVWVKPEYRDAGEQSSLWVRNPEMLHPRSRGKTKQMYCHKA